MFFLKHSGDPDVINVIVCIGKDYRITLMG